MARFGVTRTALVDAAVNVVPLAILVFFLGFYLAFDPWPPELLSLVVGVGLLLIPIVVLALATAVAAALIGGNEASG